jgi:glycosyltransferase involved in cell wall biosynthesis
MDKTRIVIASVLKPLTEPRAFGKIALSLRETNKYHLNIIGFCSKKLPILPDILFTTIFGNHRTHYSRLLAPFKFAAQLFRYQPHLVIVTTYELLPAALLGKVFLQYKLVYDVQENYSKNVVLNRPPNGKFRKLTAFFIRLIETISNRYIDHYIFAEKSYRKEFPNIRNYIILENKYAGNPLPEKIQTRPHASSTFLISGTITPAYGIEEAIRWFLSLQGEMPQVKLKIIGHVPLQKFKKTVEDLTYGHSGIQLNIFPQALPHTMLLKELHAAEIVLLPYKNLGSIRAKIPTKLYESMALQKPVLISSNPLWQDLIHPYPAGISIDFSRPSEAKNHFHQLMQLPLYLKIPGGEVCWDSEKPKLLALIQNLLS